jgi:TPR repeat protein
VDRLLEVWRWKKRPDSEKAQDLLAKGEVLGAARLGLPEAQGLLASRYFYGSAGVEKDLAKFHEWAKKAAEGGDRRGQFRMAYAHHLGAGVEKNYATALKWYEASMQSSPSSSSSQEHQGVRGGSGEGGSSEGEATTMTTARRWDSDDPSLTAQNIAAVYFVGGFGVEKDLPRAVTWFRKGAEAGHKSSQFSLAWRCYNGEGCEKDRAQARKWFALAAQQDLADAQLYLGCMLVSGEGAADPQGGGGSLPSLSKGFAMIERAAANGSEDAAAALQRAAMALAQGGGVGDATFMETSKRREAVPDQRG